MIMAKILIVYHTQTGNTEKMALAVAEGAKQVKGMKVAVKKVDQTTNEDLLDADGIIVGSPTYYGLMSGKIKMFFDGSVEIHGKLAGKVGAAFTNSGGTASGAETTLLSILKAMLVHGMIVQGRYDDKHYGIAAVGELNKKEIEMCKGLGKRTAELVLKVRR